jgi:hypothetical protein
MTRLSKPQNLILCFAIASVALWVLFGTIKHRQISFDQRTWRNAGRSSNIDARYQMIDALIARLESMNEPSTDSILEMLGPPDLGKPEGNVLGYSLGSAYRGPIRWNGYYLRLVFDANERLVDASVVPE